MTQFGTKADLQQGGSMLQEPPSHSVACFVVGHRLLLLRLEDQCLLLQTFNKHRRRFSLNDAEVKNYTKDGGHQRSATALIHLV